ncbi:response regulator [uncultured Flavobacterium sp.]|uniref:response regulator n=1 Tax=uncultured Flavobacterium sp. TaxID=165435 RepID=UPI0025E1D451|nr:response regulator [uncultured Flavobacterium sp.]
MNPDGPVIIIEDDPEEAMILQELIVSISSAREIITIGNSTEAISFLRACEKPFLILSGINLRGINGFELRQRILEDQALYRKCTPYIFYSAHGNETTLTKVYDLQADGYFHDISDYNELKKRLSLIVKYWENSIS